MTAGTEGAAADRIAGAVGAAVRSLLGADHDRARVARAVQAVTAVADRYAEPHRTYHTRAHLEEMLDVLSGRDDRGVSRATPDQLPVLVLAAVFHDAIHVPGSTGNEHDSAELARQVLPRHGFPAPVVDDVDRLVELTASHRCPPGDALAAALLDADLAVLARRPAGYRRYVTDIRAEYAQLDDAAWTAGRSAILRSLLALPRLYAGPGTDRAEARARANLQAELGALAAAPSRPAAAGGT